MTTEQDDTRHLVNQISASLATLATAVDQLAKHQAAQLTRTRRTLRWTVIGLAADLMLTLLGGGLYMQVHANTEQLRTVDTRMSTQALCPLYEVFLRSYNPTSPAAQTNPAEYDHDFAVIEQGARALGCTRIVRGR